MDVIEKLERRLQRVLIEQPWNIRYINAIKNQIKHFKKSERN